VLIADMNIRVTLKLSDGHALSDTLVIAEHKLGELTDEEIEAAIERNIRTWVDRHVTVEWEAEEET
jgi:hypothetical protein